MKWLLILLVVGGLLWWLRRERPPAAPSTPAQPPAPSAIVRCAHCGLHLPQADALADEQGEHYCCAEHQRKGRA